MSRGLQTDRAEWEITVITSMEVFSNSGQTGMAPK